MKRLTFEGNFCDICVCMEVPFKYPYTGCSQRQTWERLKAFEDIFETPEDALNAKEMLANFRKYGAEPHDYATMKAAYEDADKAKADLNRLINTLFGEDAPSRERILELVQADKENRVTIHLNENGSTAHCHHIN